MVGYNPVALLQVQLALCGFGNYCCFVGTTSGIIWPLFSTCVLAGIKYAWFLKKIVTVSFIKKKKKKLLLEGKNIRTERLSVMRNQL